jgi:regulator of RNase E activity RraA
MNDQHLVALFDGLDTPSVSDAMDKLGIAGQCLGIAPLDNYRGTVVGPAFTVQYVPASTPPGSVGDFIEDVLPGDVVVIANAGRSDCTVWGDIMTQYAGSRGIAATVIDGVCRDVSKALGDGYPLFTKGRYMRTGKDRVEVLAVNQPVAISGARVCKGHRGGRRQWRTGGAACLCRGGRAYGPADRGGGSPDPRADRGRQDTQAGA